MNLPVFLPASTAAPPTWRERVTTFVLVFIPYSCMYEYFILLGTPSKAMYTNLPFEATWPIWEWTQLVYDMVYAYALLIPVVLKTKRDLRTLIFDMCFGTLLVGILYLIFPFAVHQRAFVPQTRFGELLLWERAMDGETCALPSFHVIWALVSARYFSLSYPNGTWAWYMLAVLIALSCLTTGNHSVPDVLAGVGTFFLIQYRQPLARICTDGIYN